MDILDLVKTGLPYRKVAELCACSVGTVAGAVKRNKIQLGSVSVETETLPNQ